MVKRNKRKFEMNWKKQALALVLAGILFSTSMFGLAGTGGQVRAAAPTQEANVVVLVDFNDTDHTQHQGNGGLSNNCFHINDNTNPTGAPAGNAAKTLKLFNGDTSHERALSRYISTISYGQKGVTNIFPQYDQATNTITPYKLTMNEDATLNPSGEMAMVREVIAKLAENPGVLQGADLNGDKVIDNLAIVVATGSDRESHKTSYGGDETANGLKVRDYILYSERSIYGLGMEGVVAHEYLHHLGYPDLYRSGGGGHPVGDWCIMASASLRVNYPLAYLRSAYTGWFSIPTVTSSRTGNTLYAASAATAATKDQQALVLKTPYSDSEFFVVEYRKKGPDVSTDPDALDAGVPGSGLIVYRVDTNYGTNFVGDRDMIYVFRPGDGYDGNGREQGLGNLDQAFLSAESGRTSYGSPDFSKGLSNGAITYADGTNSGIVIKNVGSAAGDTITFDISFTENAGESYWTTVAEHGDASLMTMDSYMDTDGTIYYLMQKGREVFVYQCAGGTFRQMGTQLSGDGYSYQIAKFNGSIYVSCIRSGTAKVYRMGSGSWSEVYTSPIPVTELHMSAASDGIYLVYNSGDNSAIYALAVKASGLVPLGTTVGTGGQLVNPSIAAENGRVAVSYRDFNNQNKAYVKEYQQAQNSWSDVGNLNISWDFGMIKMHNGCLYLLQNVRSSGAYSSSLYRYRFADGIWEKVGSNSYAAESIVEMDLCFYGDSPYLVYQGGASGLMYSASISNGIWTVLGSKITNEIVTGLKVYSYQNQIYVTYLGTNGKKIYLKSHVIQAGDTGAAPGGSTLPGQTTKPSDPSKPSEPSKPQQPEQPSQPGGSQQPVQPTEPGRPVRPQQPNQIVQIQPPTQSQQPASPAQPAQPAGVWVLNAVGWWYQYADGGYPTSCWLQIGGVWYAFDESGYMRTGWFWNGHAWYYLIPGSGAMAEGWQYINGVWYYLTPGSGAMAEGWQYINGLWYYLTPGSGAMQTGWVFTGGVWYYLTGSGAMAEGWQYINGEWYYLMPGSGAMQTGWYQAGGIWYYSDASGAMASSQWIGPYYVDSSGAWTRTR